MPGDRDGQLFLCYGHALLAGFEDAERDLGEGVELCLVRVVRGSFERSTKLLKRSKSRPAVWLSRGWSP